MLHIRAQGQSLIGSGEVFLKVFTTYGGGRHLVHVAKSSCIFFSVTTPRIFHMVFSFCFDILVFVRENKI